MLLLTGGSQVHRNATPGQRVAPIMLLTAAASAPTRPGSRRRWLVGQAVCGGGLAGPGGPLRRLMAEHLIEHGAQVRDLAQLGEHGGGLDRRKRIGAARAGDPVRTWAAGGQPGAMAHRRVRTATREVSSWTHFRASPARCVRG